jgi:glutaredoxin-like YruB-family protein
MMKIKIYKTEQCPFCIMAKRFFQEHNIPYEEVDVGNNPKAAEEMIEKSGQMGVPVIDIDGKIIIGFNEAEIKKALKMR